MSSDSAKNYVGSVQRRALRIAIMVLVVLALIVTPLIISGSLRMDLAHRFDLVAGNGVEQVAEADSVQILISIPIFVDVTASRTEVRYHAAYLAKPSGSSYVLTSLDDQSVITIPLSRLDFIAADSTGNTLLLRQDQPAVAVVVTVSNGNVERLANGITVPAIPGEWNRSIFATRIGRSCTGISPQQTFIACFQSPTFARFLAGDWQIDIRRYGEFESLREIYRGEGYQPVFGFTLDDAWLYFQNETGTWREPMSLDMFDS